MKIVQVISGLDHEGAGTTVWLRRLSDALRARTHDVEVFTTAPAGTAAAGVTAFPLGECRIPGLRTLLPSRSLHVALKEAARAGAVLHNNGLWRLPNLYPGWVAAHTGAPLVVSPHGMLGKPALAFSSKRKQLFSALLQNPALNSATCWHATSVAEMEHIRAFGVTAPIAVIPAGVDVPDIATRPSAFATGPRTVLFLGRLHAIKGLDTLIAAWAGIEATHPEWQLRIVGPAEHGYDRQLRREVARLGLTRIRIVPGLYGEEKDIALRSAELLVLPSRQENFGMVVAEALACGTPVICTRGSPWHGVPINRCGWWVEHGVAPLAAALTEAMTTPPLALANMGARGREWMRRDFSWSHAASEMEELYRWCSGSGDVPPHLHRIGSPRPQRGATR